MSGFKLISDLETPAAPPKPAPAESYTGLLMLALQSLGKRFVVALLNLFGLATSLLVFIVWRQTPDPSTNQLIGLGMFALFVLGMNLICRRP